MMRDLVLRLKKWDKERPISSEMRSIYICPSRIGREQRYLLKNDCCTLKETSQNEGIMESRISPLSGDVVGYHRSG